MQLTNKLGLPEAIVNAQLNDSYSKGESDYTATSLIQPARILALKNVYRDEIIEDAADGLFRLLGQCMHTVLEKANVKDLSEKRFYSEFAGKKVSAQLDTMTLDEHGILSDYKFTTAWKFKKNQPADPDWTAQLNIQAELLRRNGYSPKKLQIVGLIRDHSKSDARQYPDTYPDYPFAILPIEMWPSEKVVSFIEMRIAEHEAAKEALPECSESDRWAKPHIYAVMKGKKAIPGGLQQSIVAAEEMQAANPGTRIEFRAGVSIRCQSYCSVAPFCEQYQKTIKNIEKVG